MYQSLFIILGLRGEIESRLGLEVCVCRPQQSCSHPTRVCCAMCSGPCTCTAAPCQPTNTPTAHRYPLVLATENSVPGVVVVQHVWVTLLHLIVSSMQHRYPYVHASKIFCWRLYKLQVRA
ncbi:hypothetical protein BD779DRAFT_281235 [Infundibulicybe gibba]|nr:hypothetical protein BD779DRAFT_281235 [Infundibulicybe gibba]